MSSYDVLVAGAGPVGLACAILAAERGRSVAVIDPRTGPIDKACGEGLMPSAVAALAELGVRPEGMPFRGIAYVDANHVARHAFHDGPGLGVRRTALHDALTERAAALGVELIVGAAGPVRQSAVGVELAGHRAEWLLACDGLHSPIRRQVGLDPAPHRSGPRRYGLRRHVAAAPWSDFVEVHWSPRAEAYVTPVAPDLVGVAVLAAGGSSYDELLAQVPSLRERLAGAEWVTPVRGAGPLRQQVRGRVAGRILLVGDAGGYVDALTGEGIRTGLACARAAVEAITASRPASYEPAWRRATLSYRILTGGLVTATRPALARRHIVGAAARLPWAFSAAVESLSRG
jgi:flavin-dependent dehydrogenase